MCMLVTPAQMVTLLTRWDIKISSKLTKLAHHHTYKSSASLKYRYPSPILGHPFLPRNYGHNKEVAYGEREK